MEQQYKEQEVDREKVRWSDPLVIDWKDYLAVYSTCYLV